MYTPVLSGELVRLSVLDLDKDVEEWAGWMQDSEYQRLLDTGPSSLFTPATIRSWLEKEGGQNDLIFVIRALPEDRVVGFIDLSGFNWPARSAWVAIGIGAAEFRGRGLGTEAMQLLARYAFEQLNLNRINLTVFGYNPQAIRSYEKAGFVHEGRERSFLNRYGQRWDMVYMGLLKDDWLAQQKK
jgi:RimJ/RimL family protein N-acetyltransferase